MYFFAAVVLTDRCFATDDLLFFRINQEFEQQMNSFISGTLAFLENSCVKRVRDDTEEGCSTYEKDRRCVL